MRSKTHDVSKLEFHGDKMRITVDGKEYLVRIAEHSERLLGASDEERRNYVLSASGYGIHWPLIDEDLSVDRLIGIKHALPKQKSDDHAGNRPKTRQRNHAHG